MKKIKTPKSSKKDTGKVAPKAGKKTAKTTSKIISRKSMIESHESIPDSLRRNWFLQKYDYVVKTVKSLLMQGISPEKIALAFVMGFIAGTFPLLGTHTFIGIALAFIFGLNQVAVYLGAWLSLPLYFIILLPSLRVGEFLFRATPMDIDNFVDGLKRMTHSINDFLSVWTQYGYSILHLVIGWIPFSIFTSIIVYFFTLYFARMITSKKK